MQKFKRTMMMPAFTMGASLAMLVLMMTVMLPPLLSAFESRGTDVPLITKIAMAIINAVESNMLFIGAAIVIIGVIVAIVRRIPSTQYALHMMITRIPIVEDLCAFRAGPARVVDHVAAVAMDGDSDVDDSAAACSRNQVQRYVGPVVDVDGDRLEGLAAGLGCALDDDRVAHIPAIVSNGKARCSEVAIEFVGIAGLDCVDGSEDVALCEYAPPIGVGANRKVAESRR